MNRWWYRHVSRRGARKRLTRNRADRIQRQDFKRRLTRDLDHSVQFYSELAEIWDYLLTQARTTRGDQP